MSSNGHANGAGTAAPDSPSTEETPLTRWQKVRLVVKVVELRLRFVTLMAITGLAFAYWDTLWNHYDKWMRPAGHSHTSASGIEFYCPMHPQVIQDEPGSCPICGMPLAKRKKGEKVALPEGVTARVALAPFRIRQAGIENAEVAYAPLVQTITTVGYFAFDERRLANVVSKVPGKTRVETLFVNYTGMDVAVGQPLAELYSPELSQAIAELRTASRAERESAGLQTSAARSLLGDRQAMVRLSSEKLRRWGITQPQIDEMLKTNSSDAKIPILSPIGGHVLKKNVVEGQEVPEGYAMFEIADLHTVWVLAQVYEEQIGLIREGQAVEASVSAYPGETFSGKVSFIQPHLDPESRTVEVRFDVANPKHRLRPGMFATVTLRTPVAEMPAFKARLASASPPGHRDNPTLDEQKTCPVTSAKLGSMGDPISVEVEGRKAWVCCSACPGKLKADPANYLARLDPAPKDEVLSIPESAVIDTGHRKVVYVEAEPGVYEGRVVVLGPRSGERYPVIEGLSAGEKVAAAGAFLIDAESRINPGVAPSTVKGDAPKDKPADVQTRSASQGEHGHPSALSRTEPGP